jgi:hypothetical protein
MGTRHGVLDIAWERGAVKRLVQAEFGCLMTPGQTGKRAAAKIAVSKARTFEDLKRAVAKIYAGEVVGSSCLHPRLEDLRAIPSRRR